MAGRTRIGVSGWRYAPWRGNFYPKKLAQARELDYAARIFSSIELNGSFYSLQRPSSYAKWAWASWDCGCHGIRQGAPDEMTVIAAPSVMDPGSSPG